MFRVGSIFIPVTDLDKSIEWYEDNLGVTKIDSWDGGVGFYFPNDNTQLALIQVDEPQPSEFTVSPNSKNGYFNFLVDDIEEAYEKLNKSGVVTTEIEAFGGMKVFDFFDLDGNPFSVVNECKDSPYHREEVRKAQKSTSF